MKTDSLLLQHAACRVARCVTEFVCRLTEGKVTLSGHRSCAHYYSIGRKMKAELLSTAQLNVLRRCVTPFTHRLLLFSFLFAFFFFSTHASFL